MRGCLATTPTTEALLPCSYPPSTMAAAAAEESSSTSTRRRRRSLFDTFDCRIRTALLGFSTALLITTLIVGTLSFVSNTTIFSTRTRHPLHFHKASLSDQQVRYLAMGGASTYGQGLQLVDWRGQPWQSYPSLLGNAHNAATKTGGPELSALCTQSIVGEEYVYDVVLLEFSEPTAALELLVKRLRQRFPNATLILIQLSSPAQFAYEDTDGDIVSWETWRLNRDYEAWNSVELETAIRQQDWFLVHTRTPEQEQILKKLVQDHQVQWYALADSNDSDGNVNASANVNANSLNIKMDTQLFSESSNHHLDEQQIQYYKYTLTPYGHAKVAQDIHDLVDALQVPILQTDTDTRNIVGTWGSGDACQLWYETGHAPPQLKIKGFSKTFDKYAWQVPDKGGSLTVHNPFQGPRMVYLTYMTTSPASQPHKVYPKTTVQINGKPTVSLNPYHEDHLEHGHVTRTTAIGMVEPGTTSTIHLSSRETTLAAFRVVGVSIFPKEKQQFPIPTEFAFSPDPANVGRLYRHLW